MLGGPTTERDGSTGSASSDWRATLLNWTVRSALALETLAFPVITSQALYGSTGGIAAMAALYGLLVSTAVLRNLPYRVRALALLLNLGLFALLGFLRVGYQVGPGLGCAIVVVLAGLLLGRRALMVTFAFTLLAILVIGAYTASTAASLMAAHVGDPTDFGNWARVASAYALFTGILAAVVTFVVTHIEKLLAERTGALERLRAMSAQRAAAQAALDSAQHTILQMQKMEAVGRLAGGVAHDFNNALVVILGWADLLRTRPSDAAAARAALDEIVAAGNRAAKLTQQLLAFGRKGMLVPRAVSPARLIAEIAAMLQRVLPANIRLETQVEEGVDSIFADPGQMHQVLLNLCLNARDAMPSGGALVIRAYSVSADSRGPVPEGRWIALSVRDTGVGMDAATQAQVFEPFFTTKGDLGTGLGLSSVYGIVQQSGGHVSVESALGSGSHFCVLLPPCASARDRSSEPPAPAIQSAHGTILVAEDQAAVRNLMVTTLNAAGHTVLAAEDGSAALDLARRHRGRIDLLCTDGMMPGISSAALIADFKLLFPGASVLLCSGHVESQLLDELPFPELRCLNKPFTVETLTRTVAEMLVPAPPSEETIEQR